MKRSEFWDYSLPEIEDLVESYNRCHEKMFKDTVTMNCQLAQIIAADVMHGLNGEEKVVMPWDIYPKLFDVEREVYEQKNCDERFEEYKQQRKEYAAMMNAKRREGGVNG